MDTTATMTTMSENIVRKLLENEQIDPKAYAMKLNVNLDDETLCRFKASAIAYIKWVSGEAWDDGIAADIAACVNFDEVAQILSLYDEAGSGIGFLDMIDQGYFA